MTSILVAGPASEPISLAEAKAFARIEGAEEDSLLITLIGAARLHTEAVTGRALLAQTWRLALDAVPCGPVLLPVGPLIALVSATVYGADGEPAALDLGSLEVAPGTGPARVRLPPGTEGALEIDYRAGYGAAAEDVPADLRHAMLVLIAHWFEHRDAVIVAGSGAVVPSGFDRLLRAYRPVML